MNHFYFELVTVLAAYFPTGAAFFGLSSVTTAQAITRQAPATDCHGGLSSKILTTF